MKRTPRVLSVLVLLVVCLIMLVGFGGQGFAAQEKELLSVNDIKEGMDGYGLTVFKGVTPEEFNVRIDGVLDFGPGRKLIFARVSGGPLKDVHGNPIPLEKTGVIAAMSGSPVYIDGKLIGAVAYSVGMFTHEGYAGITPIESMIEAGKDISLQASHSSPEQILPIEVPLLVSPGLKAEDLEDLISLFEKRGFNVGISPYCPARYDAAQGKGSNQPKLEPGSSITVLFMRGDFIAGSTGTVTHIDGNMIYAFGHSLLGLGDVDFPFYQSQVVGVIGSSYDSFKISGDMVGESLGAIKKDTFAGVVGVLGQKSKMIPVKLNFKNELRQKTFKVEMVNNRTISRALIMLAFRGALRHFQEDFSLSTLELELKIKIKGVGLLRVADTFVTDRDGLGTFLAEFNRKITKTVLKPLFASPFEFELESVEFNVEVSKGRKVLTLDRAFLTKNVEIVGEGSVIETSESVELTLVLKDIKTQEKYVTKLPISIGEDVAEGTVKIKIDSGQTISLIKDIGHPRDLEEQVERLARYYFSNNQIYLQIVSPKELEKPEQIKVDSSQISFGKERPAQGWEKVVEEELPPKKPEGVEIRLIKVSAPSRGVIVMDDGVVLKFQIKAPKEQPEEDVEDERGIPDWKFDKQK